MWFLNLSEKMFLIWLKNLTSLICSFLVLLLWIFPRIIETSKIMEEYEIIYSLKEALLLEERLYLDGRVFNLFIFNWRTIALQYCVGFCHTSKHESPIGIHMSPPSWTSLPSPTPSHPSSLLQSPALSSLRHAADAHRVSVLSMVVCVFPGYSVHCLPHAHTMSMICSLCLHLHCCPPSRFMSTSHLFHIYVLICDFCLSLSDLLHPI